MAFSNSLVSENEERMEAENKRNFLVRRNHALFVPENTIEHVRLTPEEEKARILLLMDENERKILAIQKDHESVIHDKPEKRKLFSCMGR